MECVLDNQNLIAYKDNKRKKSIKALFNAEKLIANKATRDKRGSCVLYKVFSFECFSFFFLFFCYHESNGLQAHSH